MLGLSKRQIEVLELSAEGHSCKSIARELRISPETVREYLKEARYKLDSRTTTQAVVRFKQQQRELE